VRCSSPGLLRPRLQDMTPLNTAHRDDFRRPKDAAQLGGGLRSSLKVLRVNDASTLMYHLSTTLVVLPLIGGSHSPNVPFRKHGGLVMRRFRSDDTKTWEIGE
jgi:hypothetical protein